MHANRLEALSDDDLLRALAQLNTQRQKMLADLLAHLAEVDARRLYAERGFSSLHGYCVESLGMSEDAAFARIRVARLARRFPRVLELIACGRLHLTGARLLAPHVTSDNVGELLAEAAGQTRRDIEKMLARRFPKPDVPTRFVRQPTRPPEPKRSDSAQGTLAAAMVSPAGGGPSSSVSRPAQLSPAARGSSEDVTPWRRRLRPATGVVASDMVSAAPPFRLEPTPARIEPLSEERYKITFTAPQSMVDALQKVTALLSHAVPVHDVASVLERALDIAAEQLVKRRYGAKAVEPGAAAVPKADEPPEDKAPTADWGTAEGSEAGSRPGGPSTPPVEPLVPVAESGPESALGPEPPEPGPPETPAERSRYIPADVRAEVWRRDDGRCTYVDEKTGRKCEETRFLQLHHEVPWARGGVHDVRLLTLRCAAHNMMAARHDFGDAHIERCIEAGRQESAHVRR